MTTAAITPVWIRMPQGKTSCPHSGLRRGKLYRIAVASKENGWKPPVLSKPVKEKGQKSATRLINYASLMKYLDELPEDEDSPHIPQITL
jgi:hypothetical protein